MNNNSKIIINNYYYYSAFINKVSFTDMRVREEREHFALFKVYRSQVGKDHNMIFELYKQLVRNFSKHPTSLHT